MQPEAEGCGPSESAICRFHTASKGGAGEKGLSFRFLLWHPATVAWNTKLSLGWKRMSS